MSCSLGYGAYMDADCASAEGSLSLGAEMRDTFAFCRPTILCANGSLLSVYICLWRTSDAGPGRRNFFPLLMMNFNDCFVFSGSGFRDYGLDGMDLEKGDGPRVFKEGRIGVF